MAAIVALRRSWGRQKPPIGTPINLGHPLAAKLWDCLPLNECGGIPRDPIAPAANVPVFTGTPTWGAMPGGMGIYCTGGTSVDLLDRGNLAAGDFTIRLIFRPRSWPGGFTTIFDKGSGGSSREMSLFVDTSG